MDGVETFRLGLGQVHHASGDDLETRLLEATIDLTDEVAGDAVGFDDRKSAFQGHAKHPSGFVGKKVAA